MFICDVTQFDVKMDLTCVFLLSGSIRSEGRRRAPRSVWSCCKYCYPGSKGPFFPSLLVCFLPLLLSMSISISKAYTYVFLARPSYVPEGSRHHLFTVFLVSLRGRLWHRFFFWRHHYGSRTPIYLFILPTLHYTLHYLLFSSTTYTVWWALCSFQLGSAEHSCIYGSVFV